MEVGRNRFLETELRQIVKSLEVDQWRLIKSFEPVCYIMKAVFEEVLIVVNRMK